MDLKSKYITCITNEKPFDHDLTRGKRYKVEYDSEHRFTVTNDQKQTVSYFKTRFVPFDIDEMKELPDCSICDAETIRHIALYGIHTQDSSLDNKIKPGFEVCGLYPEVMTIFDHRASHLFKEFKKEQQNEKK
jgi:hypothetical protein